MRGHEAMDEIARRIASDFRTVIPDVDVRWDDDGMLWVRYGDPMQAGGVGDDWIFPEDELTDKEFEAALAHVTENAADNLWPDELVEPWPRCPLHGDHPLNPTVVRGRASWACGRDGGVAIAIGSLGTR